MSRVGNMPIQVPSGVKIDIEPGFVRVDGPNGKLERSVPTAIAVEERDGEVVCTRSSNSRQNRSLHGLTRTLVANMVTGVTEGFKKELVLEGVGYRAAAEGQKLNLLLGFSHPIEMTIPEGLEIEIRQAGGSVFHIVVGGINKEHVGQFAANVRKLRPVEPYNQKGLRYRDEVVRRKAGKAGVGGGAPGAR
jgi:large subunit ribosomal protein L6